MSVRSLKNLPLVETPPTPITNDVKAFYQTNVATGSGPNGTFLITDFFGTAAGIPHNTLLPPINDIISARLADGTLTALQDCYDRMKNVVDSVYGTPPTITVPSGAGSGVYATYDAALSALITAANTEVTTAASAMGSDTATLNQNWSEITDQTFVTEPAAQAVAAIDFATIPSSSQLSIISFIASLAGYGQNTQSGQSAEFLQAIATSNQSGQALQGNMIEGRNNKALDAASLTRWNEVPDNPTSPPPQATLPDDNYTVAEARAKVIADLRTDS